MNLKILITALRRVLLAAASAVLIISPACATTDIMLWHAMSGELGKHLDRLVSDFNHTQNDYRIIATYKGNYTETVTAAIFARGNRRVRRLRLIRGGAQAVRPISGRHG